MQPFRIHVGDAVLEDLQQRLTRTRFPDQIAGTGWRYGADLEYMRRLVAYWRDQYDWRVHERRLNEVPQYRTRIDGQEIHFVHVRSKHETALPLLIAHGWPGSIVEFLDVLGPLTDPEAYGGSADDAFHVVCPSLPGYGFSEVTHSEGWDVNRMAAAFAELMSRLGYERYGAQGGDWGALITSCLGLIDAPHLCGLHLNMPLALPQQDRSRLSEREKADLLEMRAFEREETGYQRIQGTRPQTLGFALNDSPAGLAAWIVEKFRAWSDCDGEVEKVFSKDQLLTNVMVYWVTGTITSSMRLSYELARHGGVPFLATKVVVPTGVARFPREILRFPRRWVETHYDVVHWTEMPRGGHFAAMEQPELFVGDLRTFFRRCR